jgi:alpha-1,6-mannosyltransferase
VVALPALLWAVRHRVVTAAWILVGACAVALPWYATTPDAFRELSRVSRFATPAAPWRVVSSVIQPALGYTATRTLIDALAAATALAIVVLLVRRALPPAGVGVEGRAAAFTAAITIGWVLTTAYVLPWYDSLAWASLALAGASYLDRVLLVHTGMLVLAFVPGRDVPLSRGSALVNRVLHSGISPAVLAVLVVVTVWLAVRTPRRRDPAGATPTVAGPAAAQ